MSRKQVHVVPSSSDRWGVRLAGASKMTKCFNGKPEAIHKAKEIAKNASLGQVVIHDRHGVIQTEYTYGKDPRKYKG